jgi:wnt family
LSEKNLKFYRRSRGEKEPVKPKNMDLIYLQPSPSYCENDKLSGTSGERIAEKKSLFCFGGFID